MIDKEWSGFESCFGESGGIFVSLVLAKGFEPRLFGHTVRRSSVEEFIGLPGGALGC